MEKTFSQWKKQCVNKLDLSKKGSVDEDIEHVVSLINSCEEFFTTSSCSGRVILIDAAPERSDVQKKNCVWLFVSHQKCTPDDLMPALAQSSGDAVFKFEPFVLHVQCRQLEDAQLMIMSVAVFGAKCKSSMVSFQSNIGLVLVKGEHYHTVQSVREHDVTVAEGLLTSSHSYRQRETKTSHAVSTAGHSVAINSGFRNSGLTVSKTGKIITAVRSTHGLEVPLSQGGKLLVEPEYIRFLTQVANQKMEENLRRIQRFYENLQSALPEEKFQKLQVSDPPISQELQNSPHRLENKNGEVAEDKEERKKMSVYQRRRKREKHTQEDCCQSDASSSISELDDYLDLFT